MKAIFKLLILLVFLSSCEKEDQRKIKFPVIKIEDSSDLTKKSSVEGFKSPSKSSNDGSVEAFYIGEFEVVAYDSRPGESVQNGTLNPSSDWSYLHIIPSGSWASRNHLLTQNGEIDLKKFMLTDPNEDPYSFISKDFINKVGVFELDVLEVMVNRAGVIKDGKFYGPFDSSGELDGNRFYRYPEYLNTPIYECFTFLPGVGIEGVFYETINLMAVHKSHIAEPVVILMSPYENNKPYSIMAQSRDLSNNERDFILSLVNQNQTGRFYVYLVIVPFEDKIEWDFSGESATVPSVSLTINLDNFIDMDLTNLERIQAPDYNSGLDGGLVFKVDSNSIPWNLSLKVVK